MNNEGINKDKMVLASLEAEYKHVRCFVDSIRATVTDLNFEDMVPDADERFLMGGQLHVYEAVQDNLKNRIRFYRNRIKANKPEPWEGINAFRTVETLCGPVNLINQDKVSKVEMEDIIHHCGQDADFDDACCQAAYDPNESQPVDTAPMSLHELTGMQVVGAYPKGWKCKDCIFSEMKNSRCEKKVELVGGYFLCLAEAQPGNMGAF